MIGTTVLQALARNSRTAAGGRSAPRAFLSRALIVGCFLHLLGGVATADTITGSEPSATSAVAGEAVLVPHLGPFPLLLSPLPPELSEAMRAQRDAALARTHQPIPLPNPEPSGATQGSPTDPPSLVQNGRIGPAAGGTFVVNMNQSLGAGAPSSETSVINEPSVANAGKVVFYTGNWYAALSTDGGNSFGYVNPYTVFPPAASGGFCCDQIAIYDSSRNVIFWLLQYSSNSTTGVQRIAVDQGADGTFDCYYDWTPQLFGFASGTNLDFPDLVRGQDNLYHTSNVYTASDAFAGSVIARYPLDSMAACGALNVRYVTATDRGSFRATHGATTTMYWAVHNSTAQMRIYQWAENSTTYSWNDVNHSAFTYENRDGVCNGPDGHNVCGRADSRILAAWLANGTLGFMWNGRQDGTYPYPQVRAAQFNQGTLGLVAEPVIWGTNFAWQYPSVAVNARGHFGGTIFAGGGPYYPACQAWIADDFNGGAIAPLENVGVASSSNGPTANKWGDYLTARRDYPNANMWSGTCYSLSGGGENSNAGPRFVRFGRERDLLSGNAALSSMTVSSGTLTPVFASGTLSYSDAVGNAIASVTVTPTVADATATVKVNGIAVASGSASAPIPLSVGVNLITVLVAAQDGLTTRTYSIFVTRAPSSNANLANLALSSGTLSPSFASNTLDYFANVLSNSNTMTVIPTVADATASVKVNGVAVISGTASDPITLSVGTNVITTRVTAQDGTTAKTYTVNVNYQTLATCTYTLSPSDLPSVAAAGGLLPISVTTPSACPVIATSYQPWAAINSITPSTGGITVVWLQIGANSGAARATSIVLAGRLFLITQRAP